MEGRDQLDAAAIFVNAPAQPRNRRLRPEQRVRRERPERDDDPGLDDVDLLEQERLARRHFVRFGRRGCPAGGT